MNMKKVNKSRLTRWNESAGGLFYPEELEIASNMYLKEEHHTRGVLSIAEWPEGHPEEAHLLELESGRGAVENLIVNTGRGSLAKASALTSLAQPASEWDLGYLAVGTGGAGNVPAPTDFELYNEVTVTVAPGVLRPLMVATQSAPAPFMTNLWTAQIGSTELNGSLIDEAGIYCLNLSTVPAGGGVTLFCYRVFSDQTKSAGFVWECRWTHIF
jgi:hypothetical protein